MKKRVDPLWRIVGEEVRLQGHGEVKQVDCPNCHVAVQLPGDIKEGAVFRCGLCGAVSEMVPATSVSDDGSAEIIARLAE